MIADSPRDVPDVPVEVLRAALELVVEVLRHDQRQPGAAPVSLAIRQALQARRLTKNHLIAMRKVVVSDPELRARVATVADIDLVGAAGLAWLHRGPGWEDSVRAAAEVQTAAERDEARTAELESGLNAEQRRREGAEQRAARAEARLAGLEADLARERAQRSDTRELERAHEQAVTTLRREIEGLTARAQRAEEAAQSAVRSAELARSERGDLQAALSAAEGVRDRALADRAGDEEHLAHPPRDDGAVVRAGAAAGLGDAIRSVRQLADALERVAVVLGGSADPGIAGHVTAVGADDGGAGSAPVPSPRPARRKPLALPGGVAAGSVEAARALVRAPDVEVVVDGYNVAKLGWPALDLAAQREQCILAGEELARRYGCRVLVVFDGQTVAGAAASGRRLVRIVYSPAGVIADDVIRDEVAALPSSRPVVVATNDAELAESVRRYGANRITSQQLLAVACR